MKQPHRQRLKELALNPERIRRLFNYDPVTGVLTWRIRKGNKLPGSIAGKRTKRGYISVRIDGLWYRAHRLIWVIMTGAWPENVVDHEDRNPGNNAWYNLRDVTQAVN